MACALHALNKAGVVAGHEVLVMGCGPMGLLTVAGAAARGAHVSAADLRSEAVDVAVRAGATEGLVIGEVDDGDLEKRFDVVIEASGAIPAFNTALQAVKQKGRVAILSNRVGSQCVYPHGAGQRCPALFPHRCRESRG